MPEQVQVEAFSLWAIFDRPEDYPDCFVARRFEIIPNQVTPTDEVIVADNLEQLRLGFIQQGKVKLERSDKDVLSLVETWI